MPLQKPQTLAFLRPPSANPEALHLAELASDDGDQWRGYTINKFERFHTVALADNLREAIVDFSAEARIPLQIVEVQLRNRAIRSDDLYNHWEALRDSDVYATLQPTGSQVKELCANLCNYVLKRLLLLVDSEDDRDQIIQDHWKDIEQTSYYAFNKGNTPQKMPRVFFGNIKNPEDTRLAIDRVLRSKVA